jgi:hypothetical protein
LQAVNNWQCYLTSYRSSRSNSEGTIAEPAQEQKFSIRRVIAIPGAGIMSNWEEVVCIHE